MFCAIALGALWPQRRVVIFVSSHPGASRRPCCICQICCKRNVFFHVFCICLLQDVEPEIIARAVKCPKIMKKRLQNQCFEHFLGYQYGANSACCIFYVFLPSHVGAQDGLVETIKNVVNAMVFGLFLSEVYASM